MRRVHMFQSTRGWLLCSDDRREVTAQPFDTATLSTLRPWEVCEGGRVADRHAAGAAARRANDVVKRPNGSRTPRRCAGQRCDVDSKGRDLIKIVSGSKVAGGRGASRTAQLLA